MVAENVVRVTQSDSNCVVETEKFAAKFGGKCSMSYKSQIRIIGKVKYRLIDIFDGKKELVDAKIDVLDPAKNKALDGTEVVNFFERLRIIARSVYNKYLPQNEAGLLSGIVFGLKDDIGYDFYQAMVESGTVHIAVASGFNLMLLYGFLTSFFFWFFERKHASWLIVFILLFYSLISGMQPPIFRAWLMMVILIWSTSEGRKMKGWWILGLSVWFMLVWDISLITNVSFQLSVASSFALIVVLPEVRTMFETKKMVFVYELLEKGQILTTLLASVFTLPIVYWHFGRIGLWGLVSNALVLPLVPPLMILGLLILILPTVFYVPTYFLAKTIVFLIYFFAN